MSSKYYDSAGKEVNNGDIAYAEDLNTINTSTDTAFQQVEVDLITAETSATAYANKAKAWAINPEGVLVEVGGYSALHWAKKAWASEIGADLRATDSAASAATSSTQAGIATAKALVATTQANLAIAAAADAASIPKTDAINVTSSSIVATATAVKTAYERASLGVTNSATADSKAVNAQGVANIALANAATADGKAVNAQYKVDNHTHTPAQVGLGNIPNSISASVSLSSNLTLATSEAARVAYERGSLGVTNAATAQAAANAAQTTANQAKNYSASSGTSSSCSGNAATATIAYSITPPAVGTVGSYGMFFTDSVTLNQGETIAGSSLAYANTTKIKNNVKPSGTWRCMGYANSESGSQGVKTSVTLFLRIA